VLDKRLECLLCFSDVDLSNSSNLCISEQTEQGRIALVGCETDKPSSSGTAAEITSLAQSVAKRLYDSGSGTINAEVTGR
jgi:hypothetical protein